MAYAEDAEREPLHDPQSYWTKYIWSQDHKVIAIQYSLTAIVAGLVALCLSVMMRMQIGLPGMVEMDPDTYYQYMTVYDHAWHDYGDLPFDCTVSGWLW